MADFYTASGDPAQSSSIDSSVIRAEYALIATGFTKVAGYTSAANRVVHINSGATSQATTAGFTFDGTTFTAPALAVTNNSVLTGDLAVNGGDMTSTATTFNLLNATVTTLNIGGAATTIGLGAATGTFTVGPAIVGSISTDSTSPTTGAWKTAGGLGVAKALWVGGLANVASTLTVGGVSSFANGTVSAPGIALAVDATTGWYAIGAGNPALSLGGIRALSYSMLVGTTTITGPTAAGKDIDIKIGNATGVFSVRDNAGLSLIQTNNGGAVLFSNIGTTASAANAFLDNAASNNLLRSTSSLRYKKLLGMLSLERAEKIVYGARPICFEPIEGGREHIGLAAEWMHEIDQAVTTLDKDGCPDWVQYPHLVAPLMLVVQEQQRRIAALEARST